jgi:RimJ/RimL family protein N-acetyltransferase
MLIGIGEEKGLEAIYGIVLPENTRMIGLCRALGFDAKYGQGEVEVELKLAGRGKDS